MIQSLVVFAYLAVVLYIGIFAFRKPHAEGAEDFFVAGRSLGPMVFVLSLFGTHMTAFALLGSSGHAFANGVVTYGLMASSSALVVPLCLYLFGTRIWALGRRHGFLTPVQMFRDRWECGHIGTVIAVVQAALLAPYIVVGMMGGGTALEAISGGWIPYWAGGALVALVVMGYVFFGGMRGTAWVNTFQTALFLVFGAAMLVLIGRGLGGFDAAVGRMMESPQWKPLLTRERVAPMLFLSYTFLPLSAITFPHISIFCLTAKRLAHFKRLIVFYPLCLLVVWLPSVFLGVVANTAREVPAVQAKLEARAALAQGGAALAADERERLRKQASGDDILPVLLDHFAPAWLAGLLGAGIMAAVMASDSQILALSTIFTEDLLAFYEGKERFGERAQVHMGRGLVIAVTVAAYVLAMKLPVAIFDLATQYAFTGYAALVPLLVGALYWRGSTKWGALASTLWVAAALVAIAWLQATVAAPGPGRVAGVVSAWGVEVVSRTATGTVVLGLLPVVPVTLISGLLMWGVSRVTRGPDGATLARYFPR